MHALRTTIFLLQSVFSNTLVMGFYCMLLLFYPWLLPILTQTRLDVVILVDLPQVMLFSLDTILLLGARKSNPLFQNPLMKLNILLLLNCC